MYVLQVVSKLRWWVRTSWVLDLFVKKTFVFRMIRIYNFINTSKKFKNEQKKNLGRRSSHTQCWGFIFMGPHYVRPKSVLLSVFRFGLRPILLFASSIDRTFLSYIAYALCMYVYFCHIYDSFLLSACQGKRPMDHQLGIGPN